jgi:putative FmdB family regulatory protein
MPLHEYECDDCGARFEKIQKFSDPPIEVCPTCGGHVHKLISSPAFQFKGSGFYATDYAKKDSSGGGKAGGDSKGEAPSTKDAGSSEKNTAGKKSESSSSTSSSEAAESKPAKAPKTDQS